MLGDELWGGGGTRVIERPIMSNRIMLKQGTHYHATEEGFIEIWPAGLGFAAEVNKSGRDAWVEMDEIAIAVFRAKAPH